MRKTCLVFVVLAVFAFSGCGQEDEDTTVEVVVPGYLSGAGWGFEKDGYYYSIRIFDYQKEIWFKKNRVGYDNEGNEFPYDINKYYKILAVQTVSEINRTTLFCNNDKTKDYVVCEGNKIIIVSFGEYYFSRNIEEI
jgi:hypothetical protein